MLLLQEEHQAYVTLKSLFGENIKKFMMIVFTNLDQMEGNTAGTLFSTCSYL